LRKKKKKKKKKKIQMVKKLFDLKEQASIYGSYHNTMGNKVIHFIFVPFILYGIFIILRLSNTFLPSSVSFKYFIDTSRYGFTEPMIFDLTMLVIVVWSLYCSLLDSFVGVNDFFK